MPDTDVPTAESAAQGGNGVLVGSPLAAIKASLEAQHAKVTEDIPLPGAYENKLGVRYHALPYSRAEEIAGRGGTPLDRMSDTLINACTCVLHRVGDKWVELKDESSQPVRFGRTLAEALGVQTGAQGGQPVDTRLILRGVFAAAAGGLGIPPDGTSKEELWEQALDHADHLIDTTHTLYQVWLKSGPDAAEATLAEEALGE